MSKSEKEENSNIIIKKTVKCTLVGDGAVGKACLAILYTKNIFRTEYVPTVYDNYDKIVDISGEKCAISCWVTAGQEDYDRLRPLSYPDTNVFLICFSVVQPSSFVNVEQKWIKEIRRYCPKTPILLVGTKIDLRDDVTKVLEQETKPQGQRFQPIYRKDGEELAKRIKAVKYVECSSIINEGVQNVFDEVLNIAFQQPAPKRRFWKS